METNKKSLGSEVFGLLKTNIKSYMMYIALVIIMLVFQIWSGGKFFRASNITNLFNQAAYVGVLAIGMTLILILKHIDLSVGYVAGFTGALAAILMQRQGVNEWLAILIVLAVGLAIGLYQGLTVTRLGVPAFVVTLAGMFIFKGLLSLTLAESGTVVVSQKGFLALCNGFIPDIPNSLGIHLVTMIFGVLAVAMVIVSQVRARKNKQKYEFEVVSTPIFVVGMILISAVILAVCWILATYRGIPWSAVIVGVILAIYTFMLSKTKLGRYIYGIGGNDQAAELSGVNVKQVTLFAFCSMSVLAAVAGILYTSRLSSATPTAGNGFELDAIASSYIGGTAVSGGVGKVTNAIIGTFVIMALTNGMNLMMVDISYQYIVKGLIFIIAVAFDVRTRNK
ncbi:MAG: sugar ABC transporter permease [Clostridia bacterium]|nr:sugar ABC transporter permease [Clostridia bacterium]MBQ5544711.1 sugar ABC transporter permease [Clostridia bacterium]